MWIAQGPNSRPSFVPHPSLIEVEKVESENYSDIDLNNFIDDDISTPERLENMFFTSSKDPVDLSARGVGLIRRPDDHHSECLLGVHCFFFGIPGFNRTYY